MPTDIREYSLRQIDPSRTLISRKEAASLLGISSSSFDSLRKNDPDCPKGYKVGTEKQSPVTFTLQSIYDYAEVIMKRATQHSHAS